MNELICLSFYDNLCRADVKVKAACASNALLIDLYYYIDGD